MKRKILIITTILFTALFTVTASGQNEPEIVLKESKMDYNLENSQTAVFAGGCFWGVEAVFEALEGVHNVDSGYAGGSADTASYYVVGTGKTGHAESVEIIYDPEIISFKKLLEIFFTIAHDPTQLNYQGPDIGTEYRSVVFYNSLEQKNTTDEYIKELDKSGIYKDKIVTEVTKLDKFYRAEEYHQDFMRLNPTHSYIVYWDAPKLKHLQKVYPELLKK